MPTDVWIKLVVPLTCNILLSDKHVNYQPTGIVTSNFCNNYINLVLFCVVYGFTSCGYWVLTGIVCIDVTGVEKFVLGYGLQLLFMGVSGMVGPPISGKILLISHKIYILT